VSSSAPTEPADLAPSVEVIAFPAPVAPDLARSLDFASIEWRAAGDVSELVSLVSAHPEATRILTAEPGFTELSAAIKELAAASLAEGGVLALIKGGQLGELMASDAAIDDFCVVPFHAAEFEARLARVRGAGRRMAENDGEEVVRFGALVLNVDTYQAAIGGRPLDLTYMEYELLKFLAQSPGKVFTRASLLSEVWGYDYYGGARTVDVHVRRLRAKLGEEHSSLIQTVRSVGYKLGEVRWPS